MNIETNACQAVASNLEVGLGSQEGRQHCLRTFIGSTQIAHFMACEWDVTTSDVSCLVERSANLF